VPKSTRAGFVGGSSGPNELCTVVDRVIALVSTSAPLPGIRVVEAGAFAAVPSGVMTLAMLGADVVRIDPIGGASDQNRPPLAPDDTSIYRDSLNRGKRSITIVLRSQEGRELARDRRARTGPTASTEPKLISLRTPPRSMRPRQSVRAAHGR